MVILKTHKKLLHAIAEEFGACTPFHEGIDKIKNLSNLKALIHKARHEIGAHIGAGESDDDNYGDPTPSWETLEDELAAMAGNGSAWLGSLEDMHKLEQILKSW